MLVPAWLPRAAASRPDHVALESGESTLSYAALLARARAGAAELAARGVSAGERVGLALPAGPAFVVALHACLLRGAVAVPVDPRLAPEEREAVIDDTVLVVEEPLAGEGGDGGGETQDLDAPALVIHTSGTTSAPRPVVLTHGNLLWSALGSAVALGSDPADRWLCTLPLAHVGGLSILVRSAIFATTAVLHERFDADRAVTAIEGERITLVSVVATTLSRLLDAGLADPVTLRCALAGGGPVPLALLERAAAAGVPVSQTYGLSETCSQVSTVPVGAELCDPGAGPPLFCTRVAIGEEGEILVRGPTVAPGAVAADGWLHTGDEGRIDEQGCLHVTGRLADTIVSGGENVAPAEVEAVLEAHPAVREAAVVGRPDEEWGEALVALVVADPWPGEQELRAHCAERLARFKVPKAFVERSEPLPRTRSGKLLRRALSSPAPTTRRNSP